MEFPPRWSLLKRLARWVIVLVIAGTVAVISPAEASHKSKHTGPTWVGEHRTFTVCDLVIVFLGANGRPPFCR